MSTKLLNESQLEWSTVVANNTMNRERIATGVNSYEKEIGCNPIQFLLERNQQETVRWLDLCCGQGKALIQAHQSLEKRQLESNIMLTGIDLVDYFAEHPRTDNLELRRQNLSSWTPDQSYDLITIVHGLHYIGDKLGLIVKIADALKDDGVFVGNLSIANIIVQETSSSLKAVQNFFKQAGIEYNARTKRLRIVGRKNIKLPFRYLGADDKAGPNYTGQPVVNSVYSF